MKRLLAVALLSASLGVVAALAASRGPGPLVINVESIMGQQTDPRAERIKNVPLGATESSSARLVMVHDAIEPHYHAEHDEIVLLLRGKGDLRLGDQSRELRRGDVVFIPRGTPHSFVSTGGGFAGALSVMSPPYDGKDMLAVPPSKE